MTPETEAANLAEKYRKLLKFAASKGWQKWRAWLASMPESSRPFEYADFDQWALEGLLVLGDLMKGPEHIRGRLAEFEADADKGDRYVQSTLDRWVSAQASHAASGWRAEKRGGGEQPLPLVLTNREDEEWNLLDHRITEETSPDGLTGLSERFPILHVTEIGGLTRKEAMVHFGLKGTAYDVRRKREREDFEAWALANRRVAA